MAEVSAVATAVLTAVWAVVPTTSGVCAASDLAAAEALSLVTSVRPLASWM